MDAMNTRRRILVGCICALVPISLAGCSKEITASNPEGPPAPGFSGDWAGSFQGSQLVLSIRPFTESLSTTGSLRWRSIDWPIDCTAFVLDDEAQLDCSIEPTSDVAFCGDPAPFLDITVAVPRTRLEADVGGQIREGDGSPCDGPVLQSLEPSGSVQLVPN